MARYTLAGSSSQWAVLWIYRSAENERRPPFRSNLWPKTDRGLHRIKALLDPAAIGSDISRMSTTSFENVPIEMDERGLIVTCEQCGTRNRLGYARLGETFRCGKCQQPFAFPEQAVDVTTGAAFDALVAQSPVPLLIDFWAPWCGPCKMVAPELAKVAAESAGRFLVVKVNTEQIPEVAQRFGVSAIPTLALFRNGREAARQAGAMPAAGIRDFISRAP